MEHSLNLVIRVRREGYRLGEAKTAALLAMGAEEASDAVVRRVGDEYPMLLAPIGPPDLDLESGEALRTIDFTPLRAAGQYFIDVPGIGRSDAFEISADD